MDKMKKIAEKIKKQKRLFIIVVLGVTAITLIVLSEILPKNATTDIFQTKADEKTEYTYDEKIQNMLTEIITNVEGAGKTKVMVTLESSSEDYYAKNNKSDYKKSGDTSESKSEESYVIDKSDGSAGIVLKTDEPKVRGVIVVCEGGENLAVKSNVTNAVSAALGIGTNNICVLKMKSTEE